jgi:hypothetical protein
VNQLRIFAALVQFRLQYRAGASTETAATGAAQAYAATPAAPTPYAIRNRYTTAAAARGWTL